MGEINRNASPSAFGWTFQVGAGITLMLDYVKTFKSLKIEGKSDDIELSFDEGKIYAQAKSVTQIGDQKTAAALEVLSDDVKNNDAIKLIYVTNIANPLSSRYESAFEYEHLYEFSVLPEEDQEKIISKVGDNFPIDKFQVYILRFFGEGNNKFTSLQAKIARFLQEILKESTFDEKLLNSWFTAFMANGSDRPSEHNTVELTKDKIFLPVMAFILDNPVSEERFNEVCNYDDYDGLVRRYSSLIDRQICEYEFYASVMGEYNRNKEYHIGDKNYRYTFVRNSWEMYKDWFSAIAVDNDECEALAKITLLTLIEKQGRIRAVQEAVGL